MIYLCLSILVSSSLFVIFKLFNRFHVNTFNAIVTNYVFACLTGLFLYDHSWTMASVTERPWFGGTIFLGFMFIMIFMVMARTAQEVGLSVASVAGKMSLIIPVIFGVLVYGESAGLQKIFGILLALLAVVLVSVKNNKAHLNSKNLFLPLILFAGSGIIDTTIKYLETRYVSPTELPLYSSSIFGIAALFGFIIISYKAVRKRLEFRPRDIAGGLALGIPNYFSIFFILKALRHESMESSVVFSVNNVAIVMLTTIFGIILFREQLQPRNWIGVFLAVISILLISLAKS
ncbi:EamA family transporter [Robertkochia flava]|uniref:EamA family transporter n=1 Tax=Robertkochia flava TaxID=3447986 RepID=UPI001CCA5F6D|nr:EamA family transporter [Robertkochia marina]